MNGSMLNALSESYADEEYLNTIQPGDWVMWYSTGANKKVLVLSVNEYENYARVEDENGQAWVATLTDLFQE